MRMEGMAEKPLGVNRKDSSAYQKTSQLKKVKEIGSIRNEIGEKNKYSTSGTTPRSLQ